MVAWLISLKRASIFTKLWVCKIVMMDEQQLPLVSLCMPTYNGERYLREAIYSALNQTYKILEILIIDDGSSDQTVNIITEFVQKDSRIKFIQNTQNLGLVGNWNKCLHEANGDWIQFLFQDDLMHRECIETLVQTGITTNKSLVICDRDYFFEAGIDKRRIDFYGKLLKLSDVFKETQIISPVQLYNIFTDNFLGVNFIGEPIVGLIKKQCISTYGVYNLNLRQICDFEFWIRVGFNEGFAYIPKKLVSFRVNKHSESSKNESKKEPVWLIDRILWGHLLLHDPHFKLYAKYTGVNKLKHLYKNYLIKASSFISKEELKEHLSKYEPFASKINMPGALYLKYHSLKKKITKRLHY